MTHRLGQVVVLVAGLLLALVPCGPAFSQELELPGLSADANAYAAELHKLVPAGLSAGDRQSLEAEAEQAAEAKDWAQAASLLERRLGASETTPALWLALAQALERQPNPDHAHAAAAAWRSFAETETGTDQLPALRVMRTAFAALDQKLPEIEVLQQEARLAPDDDALKRDLVTRMQAVGLLVCTVKTQPESFPARACIGFTGTVGGSADFHPGDWVKAEPAIKDMALTLESGDICVAGLTPGATLGTAITLCFHDGVHMPGRIIWAGADSFGVSFATDGLSPDEVIRLAA